MAPLTTLKEPLSIEEKKFYGSVFKTLDPKHTGLISGVVARPLLEASTLPLNDLGEIWNLADNENSGFLNQFSFCIAMRLISYSQFHPGAPVDLDNANYIQPLAKFQSINIGANTQSVGPATVGPSAPRIVSTNSMQSVTSNSSASSAASKQLIVPLLLPAQAANFGLMFDKTAVGGQLDGNQAKNIFLKARLPINILESIWNLVDKNENGKLNRAQFIIAMHLIQCCMNKSLTVLPNVLSNQLWKIAETAGGASSTTSSVNSPQATSGPSAPTNLQKNAVVSPAPTPSPAESTNLNTWIMSPQQKQQYGAIFDTLDKSKSNFITSGTVANFLMTSNLPNQILANIWELSNLDESDNFNKQEFSIAMYLVQKKLAGYELPDSTPQELVESSKFEHLNPVTNAPIKSPQPFETVKNNAASQRTASHMDDLMDIFHSAPPIPPAPESALPQKSIQTPVSRLSTTNTGSNFSPSSNFGRTLQQSTVQASASNQIPNESSSDDDDEGPENLDLPRVRNVQRNQATVPPPVIPGRSSKPLFDKDDMTPINTGGANYDAIKNVDKQTQNNFNNFSNQAANTADFAAVNAAALGGFTGAATAAVAGGVSSIVDHSSANSGVNTINDQITQASVDIANYTNQISSLSKQTTTVSARKERAQNELNKILKHKEDIVAKLSKLKALNENESQQVIEVQNLLINSKEETDSLENELSIVEANYHAYQAKKEQLQSQYDESQRENQLLKEKLGNLNAVTTDLKSQFEELSEKLMQSNNLLAVSQQQVVTQENINDDLRNRIHELNNSILQIDAKHSNLLARIDELNDENLELHNKNTELSIDLSNKTYDYSETLAKSASRGIVASDDEGQNLGDDAGEEVPTATLDDFDFEKATKEDEAVSKQVVGDKVDEAAEENENNTQPTESDEFTEAQADKAASTTATTASTTMSNKNLSYSTTSQSENSISNGIQGQQFSLPFDIPHSETSSTQNNPSQSVRGDLSPDSTSTIEGSDGNNREEALSSQILPEGTLNEINEDENKSNGESFEFVNHPSTSNIPATVDLNQNAEEKPRQPSISGNSEIETLSENKNEEPAPQTDEFPPIQELHIAAEDSSTDEDEFEDAKNVKEDSRNPFGSEKLETPDHAALDGDMSELSPAEIETGPSMFDDLGLEEAEVEEADHFDANTSAFAHQGFTFSNDLPNEQSVGNDDWEQVFEGFGNDPHLQPAAVEELGGPDHFTASTAAASEGFSGAAKNDSSTDFTYVTSEDSNVVSDGNSNELQQSQKFALEELLDMGFDESDAIAALRLKDWNIDDASNYLLENA